MKEFARVCEENNLTYYLACGTCLGAVRHNNGVPDLFDELRSRGIKIGIITDGRPEGQRNKIKALDIENKVDEIIITDELGGPEFRKPDDISFRIMQKKMGIPFESMVYVADNLFKDFVAPNKLGMRSSWFKNKDGIFFSEKQKSSISCIVSLDEVINKIDLWQSRGYKSDWSVCYGK